MGDFSDFERGQTIGACLAGASVTKTATLLGILKVMWAYTSHGKTTSAKRNSGQKSALAERDHCTLRRTVLKSHRTTAA
jgi:hypothetical protein